MDHAESAGARRPTLRERLASISKAVNGALGVPDYERYLHDFRARYPGETPLTKAEFEKDRLHERYIKPGNRCV
jgi:uncharacterized short protein YbdD (DUF466 family)